MLKHSKKRKESGETTRQQDSQRKREYDLCPVCLRSIPSSFLDIHAKTCLDNRQQQSQQENHFEGNHAPSLGVTGSPVGTNDIAPSQVLLPPTSTNPSSPDPVTQQILTQGAVPKERSGEGETAEGRGGPSGTQSAVHVMMQAQRRVAQQQQPQNHVFYLEWDDGSLQGHGSGHLGNIDSSQFPSSSACESAKLTSGSWRCYWWKQGPLKKQGQGLPSSTQPSLTAASLDPTQPSPHSLQHVAHHPVPGLAPSSTRPRSVPCWSASTVIKEKGRRAAEAAAASSPSKSDGSTSKGGWAVAAGAPCHILLQTNVPPGQGGAVNWQNTGMRSNVHIPAEGVWRGHPSALKSALQKAVRRGMAPAACRLSLQMLKDDPAELLRRLPIICLEDTTAHPTLLPVVVWLMCAQSKGFQLGALHAAAVQEMTYQLACVGIRDHLPTHPPTLNPGPRLHSFSDVDQVLPSEGLHQESVLVKAILLRAQYGGMAGDVESCKGYAQLWCGRFAASSRCQPPQAAEQRPLFCNVAHPPASPTPSNAQPSPHAASVSPREPSTLPRHSPHLTPHTTPHAPHTAHYTPHTTPQQGAPQQLGSAHPQGGHNDATHQEECQGLMLEARHGSAWFAYLTSLYEGLRKAPMELSCVAHVGALRRSDVPLAAIDFHVSDIVEHLLEVPHVAAAAHSICCASWGIEGDANAQMRNAMWLFRSSVNHRAWLPLQRTAWSDSNIASKHDATSNQVHIDLVAYEHQPLVVDLEQEAAQKDRLLPMWQAAEPVANQFAANLIVKRFQSNLKM